MYSELNFILTLISALGISYCTIPLLIEVAQEKQLFDRPGGRKTHAQPVPALGGIALFLGFFVPVLLFASPAGLAEWRYVLVGGLLLCLVGLKDDLVGMGARQKLFLQAGVVVLLAGAGFRLEGFYGVFGWGAIPEWAQVPLTTLFLLLLINAYNLIDGIDGLAGSLALTSSLIFALLFYLRGDFDWCLMALALSGAILSFLRFNFYRATIFMGDNGSMVLGLLLGLFAIRFLNTASVPGEALPVVAIVFSLLAIPVLDLVRVSGYRLLRGRSPFSADRGHLHHLLLQQGFSTPIICLLLVVVELSLFGLALQLPLGPPVLHLSLQTLAFLLLVGSIYGIRQSFLTRQNDSVLSK
ncbi:MAG: MraY family glycosyltransferase [Bacteroidota bacterium]